MSDPTARCLVLLQCELPMGHAGECSTASAEREPEKTVQKCEHGAWSDEHCLECEKAFRALESAPMAHVTFVNNLAVRCSPSVADELRRVYGISGAPAGWPTDTEVDGWPHAVRALWGDLHLRLDRLPNDKATDEAYDAIVPLCRALASAVPPPAPPTEPKRPQTLKAMHDWLAALNKGNKSPWWYALPITDEIEDAMLDAWREGWRRGNDARSAVPAPPEPDGQ